MVITSQDDFNRHVSGVLTDLYCSQLGGEAAERHDATFRQQLFDMTAYVTRNDPMPAAPDAPPSVTGD
jgi:hypothetical protein